MEITSQKNVDNFETPSRAEGSTIPSRAEGHPSDTTYTLSEVAKYLDINEGTLRNWEKRFGEFLSNYRNQYNHRVFTDADIKILEKIKGLMESGLFTQTGVKHMINSQQGSITSQKQEKGSGLDEEYKEKLMIALNSVGSEIHALRREMREDLKGSLRRDIEHLTLLLFPPEEKPKPSSWWKLW